MAHTDLTRRYRQGLALPRRIVLSFAPSAAAGWHCLRVKINCEIKQHDAVSNQGVVFPPFANSSQKLLPRTEQPSYLIQDR